MVTHLVLPDAHVKPGVSLRRFEWLGKLIVDMQPEKIICLGDFVDMESLSSYDKGKKSFEGRSYEADVHVGRAALNILDQHIAAYNLRALRAKRKQYKPELHMLLGNHEERINRVVELNREYESKISIKDLQYEKYGWTVYPFLQRVNIDGVVYAHYFTSGVMGRPISGEHPANSILVKQFTSCIQGHVHTFDYSERTNAHNKKIQAVVMGCFLDEDQYESYAKESNHLWKKGVGLLHNVEDGQFDFEWISIQRLKQLYSN